MCICTHSAAKVGWLLNTGMSFSLTDLTTDLVKLEKEVVLLCQFGWQLNLNFFIEFWLPEWKIILLTLYHIYRIARKYGSLAVYITTAN